MAQDSQEVRCAQTMAALSSSRAPLAYSDRRADSSALQGLSMSGPGLPVDPDLCSESTHEHHETPLGSWYCDVEKPGDLRMRLILRVIEAEHWVADVPGELGLDDSLDQRNPGQSFGRISGWEVGQGDGTQRNEAALLSYEVDEAALQ